MRSPAAMASRSMANSLRAPSGVVTPRPGDAQRHLGVDVAVGQLEPPLARDIGLGAVLLDAGDAGLDGVLALVEVGVLDRPDLVARRGLLAAAVISLSSSWRRGRGGGIAAQQLLARLAEAAS